MIQDKTIRSIKEDLLILHQENKILIDGIKIKEQSESQKISNLTKKIDLLVKQNYGLQQQLEYVTEGKYKSDKNDNRNDNRSDNRSDNRNDNRSIVKNNSIIENESMIKDSYYENDERKKFENKLEKDCINEKEKDFINEKEIKREKSNPKFNNKNLNNITNITNQRSENESVYEKKDKGNNNQQNNITNNLQQSVISDSHIEKISIYDKENNMIDDDIDDDTNYDLEFLDKYHSEDKNIKLIKQELSQDKKIIRLYDNGKKELIFPSGVRKEIFPDSYQIVYFTNNDIKQVK